MNIKQSDFHSNPFRCLRHSPSRNSPLLRVILSRPELRPLVIIIPMSHRFVKHFIIHMFHTSVMPYISLDQYLNPKLYIIPNMNFALKLSQNKSILEINNFRTIPSKRSERCLASSWITASICEQRRLWWTCADAWTFAQTEWKKSCSTNSHVVKRQLKL